MINLIPRKAKRNILIEYWVRVSTVWLILWSIALLVGAAIVLPTYVLITGQTAAYEKDATEASQNVANFEISSKSLVQSSMQARAITEISAEPLFSDYVSLFESLQGSGIQISQIELGRSAEGMTPIHLTGSANDRQTLADFRDRLRANEQVGSVDLPISNLASDSDIKFTIIVTLVNTDKV